jgi:hypothetical protein
MDKKYISEEKESISNNFLKYDKQKTNANWQGKAIPLQAWTDP